MRKLNKNSWWFVIGAVILIILSAAIVGATRAAPNGDQPPDQPIPYSHRDHVGAGIQCLYCHSEASRSPIAGIPSVQKCVGCHQVIAEDSQVVQEVIGYWERQEPIPWQRVNIQPDFVYFSHSPHLGAGLNCETCHGNVAEMDSVEPVFRMDMGWCLRCHEEQPPEKLARLVDCVTCHK